MQIHQIAAVGKQRQLSWQGKIPFSHPEDMAHFKNTTWGHCVIMGRKTMDSLKSCLPHRLNLVVSRQHIHREGFILQADLEQALHYAQNQGYSKCFIIGGSEIYQQTMALCRSIYLSVFEYDGPGDVFFPNIDIQQWHTASTQHFNGRGPHPAFTLRVLERNS